MRWTPHADVNMVLERLLSSMRRVLGEKLIGAYLYGSLTTGDFDPGVSDIDLLAVTSSNVSGGEFEELGAMHAGLARELPEWDDRIDVQYLSLAALRSFRTERSPMAWISGGEPFHMTTAGAEWLMNWHAVRETGVALFGPPAEEVIPLIEREEFEECVRGYVAELAGRMRRAPDRRYQAHAVLTACRALHLRRTGEQASKRQAALWAQTELPEWSGLIRSALAWREVGRGQEVDEAATRGETLRFVTFVKRLISG